MKIVTVSRAYGSGGSQFAKTLADNLGYRYVDATFLKAVEKGPREHSPLFCTMEEEVGPGFLEKFAGLLTNHSFYKTALAVCVLELVLESDVVIVGAGGHLLLSGCPSLMSFQVVKKLSERVRSVAHERGLKIDAALKLVEGKDKEKSQFVKYYFDKELFDPLMFHLTINAGLSDMDEMARLMTDYCRDIFARVDENGANAFLKDRLLEKKAQMVVFHLDLAHGTTVEFEAQGGNLTIHGVVGGEHDKESLRQALLRVSGVSSLADETKVEVLSRNLY